MPILSIWCDECDDWYEGDVTGEEVEGGYYIDAPPCPIHDFQPDLDGVAESFQNYYNDYEP